MDFANLIDKVLGSVLHILVQGWSHLLGALGSSYLFVRDKKRPVITLLVIIDLVILGLIFYFFNEVYNNALISYLLSFGGFWQVVLVGLLLAGIGFTIYSCVKNHRWLVRLGLMVTGIVFLSLTFLFLYCLYQGLMIGYFQDPRIGWKWLIFSLVTLVVICTGLAVLNLTFRIFVFTLQIAKLVSIDVSILALKKLWETATWPFKFTFKVIVVILAAIYAAVGDVAEAEKLVGLLKGQAPAPAETSGVWRKIEGKLKELETSLQQVALKTTLFFKHIFAGILTASLLILVFGGQHRPNTLTSFLSDHGAGYALLILIVLFFSKLWLDEYQSSKEKKGRVVWRYVAWTAGFVLFISLLNQVGIASYLNQDAFRFIKAGIVRSGAAHQVEAAKEKFALGQTELAINTWETERFADTSLTFYVAHPGSLLAIPPTIWAPSGRDTTNDTTMVLDNGKRIWLPLNSKGTLVKIPMVLSGRVFFEGDFEWYNQRLSLVSIPNKNDGLKIPNRYFIVPSQNLSISHLSPAAPEGYSKVDRVTKLPKSYYSQGGRGP